MAQVKAKGVPFSTTDENVDQNSAWNLKGSTKRNSFGIIAIAIWKLKALKSSFIPTFFSSSCHSSLFSYFFWCGIFYAKPFLGHNLYSFWFNGEKSTLLFPSSLWKFKRWCWSIKCLPLKKFFWSSWTVSLYTIQFGLPTEINKWINLLQHSYYILLDCCGRLRFRDVNDF